MAPPSGEDNIILIGMPGVGKSTVGVLLAKVTMRGFVDTDVLIQRRRGRPLQEILDDLGPEGFCRVEEACILSLKDTGRVIATGGSAVYSHAAMEHLRASGPVVHLHLPLERLRERIEDLAARGVVMAAGDDLRDLYHERSPLYRRWADLTIDCTGLNQDQVVERILAGLSEYRP